MLNALGCLCSRMGKPDEAEQLFLKMPGIIKAEQKDRGKLQYSTTLAQFYEKQGRNDEAEGLQRVTLQEQRERLGERHIRTLITMTSLAKLYQARGSCKAAEQLLREALEHRRRTRSPMNPRT